MLMPCAIQLDKNTPVNLYAKLNWFARNTFAVFNKLMCTKLKSLHCFVYKFIRGVFAKLNPYLPNFFSSCITFRPPNTIEHDFLFFAVPIRKYHWGGFPPPGRQRPHVDYQCVKVQFS